MTKEAGIVLQQERIATDIYSLWIQTTIAGEAQPGQFLAVYPSDGGMLLQRPISICEVNQERSALRLVYRVAGKGTHEFATYKKGDSIDILGPCGNGFPTGEWKHAFLIGGGIGIPPMLQLAKEFPGEKDMILGFRDELFLEKELSEYGNVYVATEDGSAGTKGNVLDAIKEHQLKADVIFACGPMPMLRAIKKYAEQEGIPAYISLEERMACGVGACLGCVCETVEKDAHSHVNNTRICMEGPVFEAKEVRI